MKKILTLACVVLLTFSFGGLASADITIAGWDGGAGTGEHTDMDPSFAGASGGINNYISTASTAINVTNYPGTPANTFVGSLNFVNQLDSSGVDDGDGDMAPGAFKEFRIRNGAALNPETGGAGSDIANRYTQLYWSDASVVQTVAGVTWNFSYSNNSQTGTVRAAVRDTNGDWFLSSSFALI